MLPGLQPGLPWTDPDSQAARVQQQGGLHGR